MWQWLVSAWEKIRGRKRRRLSFSAATGVYTFTGGDSVPRKLRVGFPSKYTLTATVGAFAVTGTAATLSYLSALSWKQVPPLSLTQGTSLSLVQYVNNPQNLTLSYSLATGTLPSGVSLTSSGTLTASSSATVSTASGVSFYAATASTQYSPLTALTGSYTLTGKSAILTAPASTGPLTMTVDQITYTGYGLYLGSQGAASKNLIFCQYPAGTGKWYKIGGDHPAVSSTDQGSTPTAQGGRQEIFEIDFSVNSWTLYQKYYIRTGDNLGTMQMALPDDPGGCMVGSEFWYTSNNTNGYPGLTGGINTASLTSYDQTNFGSDIVTNVWGMCAWNPGTRLWRSLGAYINETNSGQSWCSMYHVDTQRVIIPANFGVITLDASVDPPVDITNRSNGNLVDQGFPFNTGLVQLNNKAYAFDIHNGCIKSLDLTTGPPFTTYYTVTTEVTIPEMQNIYLSYTTHGGDIVWYPPAQAFIVSHANGMIAAWQPSTNTVTVPPVWTTFDAVIGGSTVTFNVNRKDGWMVTGNYIHPAKMIYDPVTQALYGIGGIDFDTGTFVDYYWRLHFQ